MAQKASKSNRSNSAVSIKGGDGLLGRIATITAMVNKNLGKYEDKYDIIREEQELESYIDNCIKNGAVAIDTETNSLDPITCTLAGFSLYTKGCRGVYIPVHHVSYITGQEVENQMSEPAVKTQLQRLVDAETLIVMFNGKFDTRVLYHRAGVQLTCKWDCYLAARLLNENEKEQENGLKALHKKYCLNGEGDAFSFNTLFSGIPFTHIPIKTGYIYAARDAEITYELYEFQKPYLTPGTPECEAQALEGPAWVFHNIEIPLIPVVAKMEDTGVAFDFEYAQQLSEKYNKELAAREEAFYKVCENYRTEIDDYKKRTPNHKLDEKINIGSPTQIAILLYDILKKTSPEKTKPRGTGEEILSKIDHPISKAILDYREVAKLLSTYVDKMPGITNPKTGRIHASFNQIGADTGRFSSSDPNMQNIPSHNKDIRKMFKATDGYLMLSSDYSAQEPRLTSHMSRDQKMIQAYIDGKDLYVEIASLAFDQPYDECKEFRADGTTNPEGKKRRGMAKVIVLGVCYGKGVSAIADDLGVTKKKAQEIYDKIMKLFPGLKNFMDESENMARELGYVTTVWGRKRRLPNMQLPRYEFSLVGGVPTDFDPLFDEDEELEEVSYEVDPAFIDRYTKMLDKAFGRSAKEAIKAQALQQGVHIKDNGGFIAEATRQCVNSRIQGSAADQTKLAMILIGNDKRLEELGFRLLLPVHDELIGECPEENIDEVAERFSALMVEAAKDLAVPSKCDVEISRCWYGDSVSNE